MNWKVDDEYIYLFGPNSLIFIHDLSLNRGWSNNDIHVFICCFSSSLNWLSRDAIYQDRKKQESQLSDWKQQNNNTKERKRDWYHTFPYNRLGISGIMDIVILLFTTNRLFEKGFQFRKKLFAFLCIAQQLFISGGSNDK